MQIRPNARSCGSPTKTPPITPQARSRGWQCLCGIGLLATQVSCFSPSVGNAPEPRQLYFPSGMVLDPRPPLGEASKWLFVVNANSDLAFNGSSLVAINLDRFFDLAFDDAALQTTGELVVSSDVNDVGAEATDSRPCRRNVSRPQMIECDEGAVINEDTTVYMTSFATVAALWRPNPDTSDRMRLFTPVRGDPSISYVDISGGLGGGDLEFECGQGEDESDPRRCGSDYRMKHLRGDDTLTRLATEPANIVISEHPDYPVGLVTHLNRPVVTLIDLDGLDEVGGGQSVLIDEELLLDENEVVGGFGIAERPCPPEALGSDLPGCTAPKMYVGHRDLPRVEITSIDAQTPSEGQMCIEYADLGEPGGLLCDFEVVSELTFVPQTLGGVGVSQLLGAPFFGEMAFSRDGNALYVTQVNPGGLLYIDTSLNDDGEVRNETVASVEICAEPQALELFEDDGEEFAAVSCYKPAEIFIVELRTFRVVRQVIAGTGPHEMVFDPVRKVLYAANTLDATISVIDVSRARVTRFTEIARIGLQEPYGG